MGCRNREELPYVEEASFSDALLFATMCIVGLPVDVHARDGSIYSGIFHTASVEGEPSHIGSVLQLSLSLSVCARACAGDPLMDFSR